MTKIISRNFRVLCDFMDVYQFMIEVYEKIGEMVFLLRFWNMHSLVIGWINLWYIAGNFGRIMGV